VGLSPDGRQLAFAAGRSVELLTTETGRLEELPVQGSTTIGQPVWSPDGTMLAFADRAGLFVMNADGSGARLLHASADPLGSNILPPSWSPDGRSLAFFDATPVRPGGGGGKVHDDRFTVSVVALAGGDVTDVHDAGHCYCIGLSPPALTWSPDGELIAVATTHGMRDADGSRAPGVYVVHPDGSGWRLLAAGYYRAVAWQPVIE
jgi:Tol biopolymer transport system component